MTPSWKISISLSNRSRSYATRLNSSSSKSKSCKKSTIRPSSWKRRNTRGYHSLRPPQDRRKRSKRPQLSRSNTNRSQSQSKRRPSGTTSTIWRTSFDCTRTNWRSTSQGRRSWRDHVGVMTSSFSSTIQRARLITSRWRCSKRGKMTPLTC